MRHSTIIALVGLMLVLVVGLGCGALGLGVRNGQISETLVRIPPQGRYQLIVRIGNDGRHWGGDVSRQQAVNIWFHGSRTDWHFKHLLRIPLGERELVEQPNLP